MHARLRSQVPRLTLLAVAGGVALSLASCGGGGGSGSASLDPTLVAQGQQVFRSETFGDETFFSDVLRLHEPVATVTPRTALAVGLKVDSEALPPAVVAGIQNGSISLDDPATTIALLKLNAVIGLKGQVDAQNKLVRLGVTCAICHSTVDNSFTKGVGKRLDGWPNRDLDVGKIIALSPTLAAFPDVVAAYQSWGPGMYDARFNIVDGGTPFHGDGISKPSVIPPAYGLLGINKTTFTGDGNDIAYWNRYVAVTQFGGHGNFTEPRLGENITNGTDDLVSAKLPALQAYQLSIPAPQPPAGSFDGLAAVRGLTLFNGKARCSTCHSGPNFTDANERLHPQSDSMAAETAPTHADRSATKQYRTSPLRGVWQHPPYFHDGSAKTLDAVVATYNSRMTLGLSAGEMADLVQYLKSL